MRFNDKELATLAEGKSDLEGILHYMKPQGNDWSDWYQQPQFKERYFKLKKNLLFYYRLGELKPLGVIILENAQVAYESPNKGIQFAFSLTFRFNSDEGKHIFCCRCESDVDKWVQALKIHSYEYWRTQYIILKTKIGVKNGQNPMEIMKKNNLIKTTINKNDENKIEINCKKITRKKKSTFYYSHQCCETTFTTKTETTTMETSSSGTKAAGENLIDL